MAIEISSSISVNARARRPFAAVPRRSMLALSLVNAHSRIPTPTGRGTLRTCPRDVPEHTTPRGLADGFPELIPKIGSLARIGQALASWPRYAEINRADAAHHRAARPSM